MEFESEDSAYKCYSMYAVLKGFSIRKDFVNKSRINGTVVSRRYTCHRQGYRPNKNGTYLRKFQKETRTGCLAHMTIARQPNGKFQVTHFETEHNHEFVKPCTAHMLPSQKKLSFAQAIEANLTVSEIEDGSNMVPTSTSETNCKARLDYDPVNHEYKLPFKCSSKMKGEIEKIKLHFQIKQRKNPSFFYAFQLDADDQITNTFWADIKMIIDYTDFGDVVCFDSSYKYYKDSWPFVPFLGINNHQQMTIFGVALLQNESVESLKWLFIVFLEAMSGRKPKTILTDLDVVTAEAINVILPQTNHRVCVWHVYQDALKHLSHVSAGSDSFINDLRSCLFHHEEEDYFVNEWNALLDKYNLWENEWLQQIFGSRHRWAIAYGRQYFCADIESVLLRQNLTGNLKRYLKHDSDILPLFKYLVKVVTDWHYKELEANYDMNQRMPPLLGDIITLKHARVPYTPKIFELFQKEYEACLNLVIKHCTENGSFYNYKVSVYEQAREYSVTFDSSDETISCSCMKFEYVGILCCHALKVLDYVNIRIVPSRYILKRWTKDARV
ncbi:hypothetical protein V8G54_011628 [Vigna mungo]|uniref:Protein FAR1-RELATED SEQUENCE n=1 Tax=Vigna mungo TaxID=3915 RepID=A0AAQ3NSL1_VIGMU